MRRIPPFVSAIAIILVGVIALVVSIVISNKNKNKVYEPVEATVVRVETSYDSDDNLNYTAYIDYTVNGKEYKNVQSPESNSSMKEGDKIEILYNVDDPTDLSSKSSSKFVIIFIIISSIVILIGVWSLFKSFRGRF